MKNIQTKLLCFIVLCCFVLCCIVLYCVVLCCIVLYCVMLFCTLRSKHVYLSVYYYHFTITIKKIFAVFFSYGPLCSQIYFGNFEKNLFQIGESKAGALQFGRECSLTANTWFHFPSKLWFTSYLDSIPKYSNGRRINLKNTPYYYFYYYCYLYLSPCLTSLKINSTLNYATTQQIK
jgi:hypothetical protein